MPTPTSSDLLYDLKNLHTALAEFSHRLKLFCTKYPALAAGTEHCIDLSLPSAKTPEYKESTDEPDLDTKLAAQRRDAVAPHPPSPDFIQPRRTDHD